MRPKSKFWQRVTVTLKRVFMPYWYWQDQYHETVLHTYHPELGSYWQPKQEGGLYLQQQFDLGYRDGYQQGMRDANDITILGVVHTTG